MMDLPNFNHLSTQKCYFNPPYFFNKSWLTISLHCLPLSSFKFLLVFSLHLNYTGVKKYVVPCMTWHYTKTSFCLSVASFLKHHKMQTPCDWTTGVDGLDLATFSWKIPSEACLMNQKAMASALKSFLIEHSNRQLHWVGKVSKRNEI